MKKWLLGLLCVFCVAVCLSTGASAVDAVEKGEKVYLNGHTYQLLSANCTWHEMKAYCEGIGGYLACITSVEEDTFLFSYLKQSGESSAYFGFTDEGHEGQWEWVSGESASYTNWASGEPNNANNAEHWGQYYWDYRSGQWNDHTQVYTVNFLCEWNYITNKINVVEKGPKVTFNGHTYQLLGASRTWHEMKAYCESIGGHLACITSAEEDAFLFSYLKQYGRPSTYFGFTDEGHEGQWTWVTGEPVGYTNWHDGEPNNLDFDEHWANYYSDFSNGQWNDAPVSSAQNFFCEWDSSDLYIPVAMIQLASNSASIPVGGRMKISSTLQPSNASNKTITWSSSNNNTASVDANGYVTAKSVGEVTITASSSNGIKASCTLIVTANNSIQNYQDYMYQFRNTHNSFGYSEGTPIFGIGAYKIPKERYMQLGFSESEAKKMVTKWGGNCFGMSSSSLLFYKGTMDEGNCSGGGVAKVVL